MDNESIKETVRKIQYKYYGEPTETKLYRAIEQTIKDCAVNQKIKFDVSSTNSALLTELTELQWCRDWLDVGGETKEQENQLKVLVKLTEICDRLENKEVEDDI